MYIPLHGRSTFSFLESIGTPKILVKRAKELGLPALALTDLDVMYGAFQFFHAARDADIKPIVGVETGFVLDIANVSDPKSIGTICLLAWNNEGYYNLMKLVSYAGQEGVAYRPKIDLAILEKYKEGILAFSGGVDSWIAKLLSGSDSLSKIEEIQTQLNTILGIENCYLEIIAQDEKQDPELLKVNHAVLGLSSKMNIPCIVNNIYAYPSPTEKKTQELAMAIKDNLKLYDPQHRVPKTKNHLMSEDEIRGICLSNCYFAEQINDWVENSQKIADRCSFEIATGQALFPKYEAEKEILDIYEQYKDSLIVGD